MALTHADGPGKSRMVFLGGLFSALLVGLSLPPSNFRLAVWFSLVPLLVSLHRQRNRPGFRLAHGLTFGVVASLWALRPLFDAAFVEEIARGGSPGRAFWHGAVDAGGVWTVLTAVWMLFCGLSGILLRRRRWWIPLLGLPLLWTGLEYLRIEVLPYSFPYLPLGGSLDPSTPEAQVADVGGVYGLSFLVSLASTGFFLSLREKSWNRQLGLAGLATGVVIGCLVYGTAVRTAKDGAATLRVAVVQAESLEGGSQHASALELARAFPGSPPDLFVLPPAAGEGGPGTTRKALDLLREFARERRAAVAAGLYGAGWPGEEGQENGDGDGDEKDEGMEAPRGAQRNAMVLVDPEGRLRGWSARHSRPWFLTDAPPGPRPTPVALDDVLVGLCVDTDSYLPRACRRLTRAGAQVLLTAALDRRAWGTDLALLNSRLSALRAVENRRWLVRATRGGVSTVVSPWGETLRRAPPGLGWAGAENLALHSDLTLFSRWGWLFGPLSLLAAAAVLVVNVLAAVRARRRRL